MASKQEGASQSSDLTGWLLPIWQLTRDHITVKAGRNGREHLLGLVAPGRHDSSFQCNKKMSLCIYP